MVEAIAAWHITDHARDRLHERYFPSVSKKKCKRWLRQQVEAGRAMLLASGMFRLDLGYHRCWSCRGHHRDGHTCALRPQGGPVIQDRGSDLNRTTTGFFAQTRYKVRGVFLR